MWLAAATRSGPPCWRPFCPPHHGPTVTAPVSLGDEGLDLVDGVEAKTVLIDQLAGALAVIAEHDPARIATLGGECAASVAPFSALARRYGDDLAIVWIDSHPDTGSLHEWTDDDIGNVAEWGIRTFAPDDLHSSAQPLPDWLTGTGCSRVAIHFDVDTVDSNEIVLGLGAVANGLTGQQVARVVTEVSAAADVVALTIAEFFPRQVMYLQQLLRGFPLVSRSDVSR